MPITTESLKDNNPLKSSFQGIQTMDDFANMLLAKHEFNKQHQIPHHQIPVYQPEVRTTLFTKVSYMVTVNEED